VSGPCSFKLPQLETSGDAILALGTIASGLANGKLLPHEAESLSGLVAAFVKTIEISKLDDRLAALEQARVEDAKERRYDTVRSFLRVPRSLSLYRFRCFGKPPNKSG
jgi:hypothetical protein